MRGHGMIMYADVLLMGVGALLLLSDDFLWGALAGGAGVGLHVLVGD